MIFMDGLRDARDHDNPRHALVASGRSGGQLSISETMGWVQGAEETAMLSADQGVEPGKSRYKHKELGSKAKAR